MKANSVYYKSKQYIWKLITQEKILIPLTLGLKSKTYQAYSFQDWNFFFLTQLKYLFLFKLKCYKKVFLDVRLFFMKIDVWTNYGVLWGIWREDFVEAFVGRGEGEERSNDCIQNQAGGNCSSFERRVKKSRHIVPRRVSRKEIVSFKLR